MEEVVEVVHKVILSEQVELAVEVRELLHQQ
jgi:hypothetical protein